MMGIDADDSIMMHMMKGKSEKGMLDRNKNCGVKRQEDNEKGMKRTKTDT